MSVIARQSTARTVMVGPILDADGVAVTGAVVGALKISKNGGAPAALNGSATLTHRNTGHYSLALTTSDLDTVGQAEIVIDSTTNAMPIKVVTVVEEAVYDALFAASAAGYSTLDAGGIRTAVGLASANLDTQLSTIDTVVDRIEADTQDLQTQIGTDGAGLTAIGDTRIANLDATVSSRATPAQVNSEVDTALADIHLDHLLATDYDPASKPGTSTALLNELIENDGGVSRFTANALEQAPTGGSAPTAAAIADAVWDEARADHTTAGTFGQGAASVQGNVTGSVGSVTGAVGSVTGNVGGNVTGSVGSVAAGGITATSIASNAITAAKIATDAITADKIAANAIGASELAADAATEIATAVLTAAAADPIHANVEEVNAVALTGDGSATPWGPA